MRELCATPTEQPSSQNLRKTQPNDGGNSQVSNVKAATTLVSWLSNEKVPVALTAANMPYYAMHHGKPCHRKDGDEFSVRLAAMNLTIGTLTADLHRSLDSQMDGVREIAGPVQHHMVCYLLMRSQR